MSAAADRVGNGAQGKRIWSYFCLVEETLKAKQSS
jgi:hypothetical protein